MPPRKELCRNFQRGSCQYGDRCKFLHSTSQGPQQSRSNTFGFGTQTSSPFQQANQQHASNPFGFGVQNNSQPSRANDFGSKTTQVKPFENKWTRFSPINTSNAPASRQSDSQPRDANHKCTNPESCKGIIVEDLNNEKPRWKLTCYGHIRNGPCDIVGDISCEELRALAYDDAKQGKSLQSIVERERSLLNSKLVEFQNLLQKPYSVSSNAALGTQSSFSGAHSNSITNSGVTPSVSSFTQLGASLNTGTQSPFAGAHSNSITNSGVTPAVSSFSQLGASLNTGTSAATSYAFGQSGAFQNNTRPPGMFQTNSLPSHDSGTFGSQISQKPVQSSFSFGSGGSSNSISASNKNPFSTFGRSAQIGNAANNQLTFGSNLFPLASSAVEPSSVGTDLIVSLPKEDGNVDDSIWKKEWKWNKGEIPEQPPPDIYTH